MKLRKPTQALKSYLEQHYLLKIGLQYSCHLEVAVLMASFTVLEAEILFPKEYVLQKMS